MTVGEFVIGLLCLVASGVLVGLYRRGSFMGRG